MKCTSLLSIIVALSIPFATAAEKPAVKISVPQGKTVSVSIPETWKQEPAVPPEGIPPEMVPPTVKMVSPTGGTSLLISFLPGLNDNLGTREAVDIAATMANMQYVGGSVEKKTTLVQIKSKTVRGSFAAYTDADLVGVEKLPPGQFRHVAAGVVVMGRQVATFTILCNDLKSPEYTEALSVIADGMTAQ